MQHADRLRTGTWVPESGRHAERGALDEITAEHRLQRAGTMTYPRERPAAPPWLVDFGPNTAEFEELGRVYRGSRRAGHHPRLLVFGAVLLVAATLGIVVSMMPAHHGAQPGGPGGAPPGGGGAVAGLPVTFQADAPGNTLIGAAHATTYPGASDGMIVQTLGNWGRPVGEGALRINNVTVPGSGPYALTIYYVLPNNEPTRSLLITASGSGSVSVTVAGSATCCSWQMVRVDLTKGPNTITFSNPHGHAPALDKVVLSAL